jgi:hypothetical protein
MDLQFHFERLAVDNDIYVRYMSASYPAKAFTSDAYIRTPPINGPVTYFTAMHELGHCLSEESRSCGKAKDIIGDEAHAWLWALDNAMQSPSESVKKRIWKSFSTYITSVGVDASHTAASELAQRLGQTLTTIPRRDGTNRDKAIRTQVRRQAVRKLKIGDRLKFSDIVNPEYLRGQEVEVIQVRRTRIAVRIMTCEIGRRFKVGSEVVCPATFFDQI